MLALEKPKVPSFPVGAPGATGLYPLIWELPLYLATRAASCTRRVGQLDHASAISPFDLFKNTVSPLLLIVNPSVECEKAIVSPAGIVVPSGIVYAVGLFRSPNVQPEMSAAKSEWFLSVICSSSVG